MANIIHTVTQRYEAISAKAETALSALQPRDRLALMILSTFLLVTAILSALWFSHHAALNQQQRLTELKDNITWMQSHAVQFSTQASDGEASADKAQRLAQQAGLTLQLQDQQGQMQILVSHQNYAVLAQYLSQLAQQGISISQLDLQKMPDGLIQLKAILL